MILETFAVENKEKAGCFFCIDSRHHGMEFFGDVEYYHRGEVVLAEAGHSPCDGNTHYICLAHLSADAVIYDPRDNYLPVSVPDYAKQGRPGVIKAMHVEWRES